MEGFEASFFWFFCDFLGFGWGGGWFFGGGCLGCWAWWGGFLDDVGDLEDGLGVFGDGVGGLDDGLGAGEGDV